MQVTKWMPQNDVLGHAQTRAFLSHCGANSLYEAAYHGVPIIALPFFADQPGNALKAQAKARPLLPAASAPPVHRIKHKGTLLTAVHVYLAPCASKGTTGCGTRLEHLDEEPPCEVS